MLLKRESPALVVAASFDFTYGICSNVVEAYDNGGFVWHLHYDSPHLEEIPSFHTLAIAWYPERAVSQF